MPAHHPHVASGRPDPRPAVYPAERPRSRDTPAFGRGRQGSPAAAGQLERTARTRAAVRTLSPGQSRSRAPGGPAGTKGQRTSHGGAGGRPSLRSHRECARPPPGGSGESSVRRAFVRDPAPAPHVGPEPGPVGVGSPCRLPGGSEPSPWEEGRQAGIARPHLARGTARTRAIATAILGPAQPTSAARPDPARLGASAGSAPRLQGPLRILRGGGPGAGPAAGAGRCAPFPCRQGGVLDSSVPGSSSKERGDPYRAVRPLRTGVSPGVSAANASQAETPPRRLCGWYSPPRSAARPAP